MMLEAQAKAGAFMLHSDPSPAPASPSHSRDVPAAPETSSQDSPAPSEPSTKKARVEVPNLVIVPQEPFREAYNKQDSPRTGLLIHGCSGPGSSRDSSADCLSRLSRGTPEAPIKQRPSSSQGCMPQQPGNIAGSNSLQASV